MEYIEVAKIVNTHGIKGELKILLLTNGIDRFKEDCDFYINKKVRVSVKSIRALKEDFAIIAFDEFDNINEVLQFKNKFIYVEKDDRVVLSSDEFFISDLIGLKVYDQYENFIGEITNVIETFANDVYEVTKDEKKFYVPAVKSFIKQVNIEDKKMQIEVIEGLIND